jgi:hypothetical protein
MEIVRIYKQDTEGKNWCEYPLRYRLSLFIYNGELVMKYNHFRTGFCDHEEDGQVTSYNNRASYLWPKGEQPTEDEMFKMEQIVKDELVRYILDKNEGYLTDIDQLNNYIEYNHNVINTVKGYDLKKHKMV